MISPTLLRWGLTAASLGLSFLGALLAVSNFVGLSGLGWGLILLGVPLSTLLALAGDSLGTGFGVTLSRRVAALTAFLKVRPWLALLASALLFKIPVPLWPDGFPPLATASTLALFGAALVYTAGLAGWGRALGLATLGFSAGWAVEYLGTHTGFPFGLYTYAGSPGPTVLGVPLLVPLGWFGMTVLATRWAEGRALLAGAILVAWDVGLEALMTAQGFWTWHDPRPLWAGAPLQNFLGWWAVGSLLAWAFVQVAPRLAERQRGLDFGNYVAVEALFLPAGLLLLGQPGAAVLTLVAMAATLLAVKWLSRQS